MRRAAAWNLMGVDRSTQAAAEEAARRAGMTVAEWLDEVVAEQAAGQGVASRDLSEDAAEDAPAEPTPRAGRNNEPLARGRDAREHEGRSRDAETARVSAPVRSDEAAVEPIRERKGERPPQRKAEPQERRAPEPSPAEGRERLQERTFGRAPERKLQGPPPDETIEVEQEAEREPADDRLAAALARLEARTARREQQTAKALETMADWIERSESAPTRPAARRNEPDIRAPTGEEDRDEDLEDITPRAAGSQAPRPAGRARVDLHDAIERIQRRRGELDARQGLEPAPQRGARREDEAPRAETVPEAEPAPRPKAGIAVDALRADIADLNARLERMRQEQRLRAAAKTQAEAAPERRLTPGETDALRAELAAMRRSLGELAPRNGNVALEGAIADLGQRLDAMRKAPASAEAMGPLEEMLRQVIQTLRANDPLSTARNVEADLKTLSARIEDLARAAVDPALIEQVRRQTEDIRLMLGKAAEAAPIARIERQIEQLADYVERLANHPRPAPELERLASQFAETRAQIERALSPAFLRGVEQRLETLAARIDEALKRQAPTPDAGPIQELARRVEGLKIAIERQAAQAPATQKLEAAIADIGRKLERPQGLAAFDPRAVDGLTQRIDSLKGAFERQIALASTGPKVDYALAEIDRKLESLATAPALDVRQIAQVAQRVDTLKEALERQAALAPPAQKVEAAIADIGRRLETLAAAPALDGRQFGELTQRVDWLKDALERQVTLAPPTQKIEAAIADIGRRLETLASAPALDGRQLGQLTQRVDMLKEAVERQASIGPAAEKIEAAVADMVRKLDRPTPAPRIDITPLEGISRQIESLKAAVSQANPPALANLEAALAEIGRKLDQATFEPRPFDDLAQQVESLKAAVEQQSEAIGQAAALEGRIVDIGRKLDRPPQGLADQMAIKSTLQALSARVDDGFRKIGEFSQPQSDPALEAELLDEMARSLGEVRAAIERQGDFAESASRLESAIANLASRIETAPGGGRNDAALQETSAAAVEPPAGLVACPAVRTRRRPGSRATNGSVCADAQTPPMSQQLAGLASEVKGSAPSSTRATRQVLAEPGPGARAAVSTGPRLPPRTFAPRDTGARTRLAAVAGRHPRDRDVMFDDLGRRLERRHGDAASIAPLIAAMNKVETRLEAFDAAPLEDAIRNLSDRLDAHGPAAFDDEQLERAATLIAERIGPSAGLGGGRRTAAAAGDADPRPAGRARSGRRLERGARKDRQRTRLGIRGHPQAAARRGRADGPRTGRRRGHRRHQDRAGERRAAHVDAPQPRPGNPRRTSPSACATSKTARRTATRRRRAARAAPAPPTRRRSATSPTSARARPPARPARPPPRARPVRRTAAAISYRAWGGARAPADAGRSRKPPRRASSRPTAGPYRRGAPRRDGGNERPPRAQPPKPAPEPKRAAPVRSRGAQQAQGVVATRRVPFLHRLLSAGRRRDRRDYELRGGRHSADPSRRPDDYRARRTPGEPTPSRQPGRRPTGAPRRSTTPPTGLRPTPPRAGAAASAGGSAPAPADLVAAAARRVCRNA